MAQPKAINSTNPMCIITIDVMREMIIAISEKRIRTSSSLSVFKNPDVSVVGGFIRISAYNGRVFDCTISTQKVSLQIGGKPEAGVSVKGGATDNGIWIQIEANSFFWLEINVSEPSLRQVHMRSKNSD